MIKFIDVRTVEQQWSTSDLCLLLVVMKLSSESLPSGLYVWSVRLESEELPESEPDSDS